MNLDHNNKQDIVEAWDGPPSIGGDEDLTKLLHALASENRRLDPDIETLYENRFIETANGEELEKIGAEVGARRRNGKRDTVYITWMVV